MPNTEHWPDMAGRRDDEKVTKEELEKLSRSFAACDVGRYAIARDPEKCVDKVPVLYLVDRRASTKWWWSCDARIAYVVDTLDRAEEIARKYRGRNLRAVRITQDMAQDTGDIVW